MIPITLPFPSSHILWPVESLNHISLMFDFKSHKHMAILVSSPVTTSTQNFSGFWEVSVICIFIYYTTFYLCDRIN